MYCAFIRVVRPRGDLKKDAVCASGRPAVVGYGRPMVQCTPCPSSCIDVRTDGASSTSGLDVDVSTVREVLRADSGLVCLVPLLTVYMYGFYSCGSVDMFVLVVSVT